MQQRAVDLTLQDSGFEQFEEAIDEHLAHAVKALFEWPAMLDGQWSGVTGQPGDRLAERPVFAMAQDEGMDRGIGLLADSDLQRAAVGQQPRRVNSDGVFR